MIDPIVKQSGSAFVGNSLQATHPLPDIAQAEQTKYVSLSQWCERNFISKDIGRTLIKRKLLLGIRRHYVWWVAANPDCIEQLLEYLGVEQLAFDAKQ